MINKKFNSIVIFSLASLLLFFGAIGFVSAENRSENVKNSISATANSGGNTISGSGTIKTGDAAASADAKNYVNGEKDTENKVEARAEGNEAEVSINGESKNCQAEEGKSCSVEMEGSFASVSESVAGVQTEEMTDEKTESKSENNIFIEIAKSLVGKIKEWLS